MGTANTNDRPSNQTFVETIVRLVLERLQSIPSNPVESSVIVVETIRKHPHDSLTIRDDAVVTPAARDEAKTRGMTINRVGRDQCSGDMGKSELRQPDESNLNEPDIVSGIEDTDSPQRSAAVQQQVSRRSIRLNGTTVVLTDCPARAVYERISAGRRAAMISGISDVDRFSRELSPQVWVIDMQRMNIPAAVNAIARIAQQGNTT